MKLHLLFLFYFLAIATFVDGQFLRGRDQDQEQNAEPILVATLDLTDIAAHLEFFDDAEEGIIILGMRNISTSDPKLLDHFTTILYELSPVEIFEQLSGSVAPADLVRVQNHIEWLVGTPPIKNENTYNECKNYYSKSGDGYVNMETTRMVGSVEPHLGCVAIKPERRNGWTNGPVIRPCVGAVVLTKMWGVYSHSSIDVFEVNGDQYDFRVCWD
jgi:hypothetical protein